MEFVIGVMILGVVFALVALSQEEASRVVIDPLEVIKRQPGQVDRPIGAFRLPRSGLTAERQRRAELQSSVRAEPETAAATVKQWLRE